MPGVHEKSCVAVKLVVRFVEGFSPCTFAPGHCNILWKQFWLSCQKAICDLEHVLLAGRSGLKPIQIHSLQKHGGVHDEKLMSQEYGCVRQSIVERQGFHTMYLAFY